MSRADKYAKIAGTLNLFVSGYDAEVVGDQDDMMYIQVAIQHGDGGFTFWHVIETDVWTGNHFDANEVLTPLELRANVSASEENPYIIACAIDRVMRFHSALKEVAA